MAAQEQYSPAKWGRKADNCVNGSPGAVQPCQVEAAENCQRKQVVEIKMGNPGESLHMLLSRHFSVSLQSVGADV